jgi:hypoxanthine phosphoribosyltransferase
MRVSATPLFSASEIAERIAALGAQIGRDYQGKPVLALGVLKGATFFFADLVRAIPGDVRIGFMESKRRDADAGHVEITYRSSSPLQGENILLIDAVVDTGITLEYLIRELQRLGAAEVRVAALISKAAGRRVAVPVDYVGFNAPDRFLVGYGLDYDEKYRNLPFITFVE